MLERLTQGARQVIVLAQEEAHRLRHDAIGTGHLLVGLLRHGGAAGEVLGKLDVTLDRARARVAARGVPAPPPGEGHMPFTQRARAALDRAAGSAAELDHAWTAPEHLLLGLAADPDSSAAAVLAELGVTQAEILVGLGAEYTRAVGATEWLVGGRVEREEPAYDIGYDDCVAALQGWHDREVVAIWPVTEAVERPYRGRLSLRMESGDRALLKVAVDPPDHALRHPTGFRIDVWRAEFEGAWWAGPTPEAGVGFILAGIRVAVFPD